MNRIQLPLFFRIVLVAWAAFCSSAGPGTRAATQYWDTGIAGGIQGTSTNVGWSVSSNAWSSLSIGTTTPGTWTNGNDAVFNTGVSLAPIATVTVFSVSANSLTFGPTVNGRVVFMPGSGALTNGAGGFFSTFDAAVVTFNNDIVLSATQTWTVGYTTTINGRVSGADALWTKVGDYTLTLADGANSFSSGLVINNGTLTGSGGGTVLGTGPIEIGTVAPSNAGSFSIVTATLNVNAGAVNTTTTISNLTVTGGATLQLNNATANVTNTLNAATLARTGLGTLIVLPANSLGVREKIFFTDGTNLINGILAPWLVTNAKGGDFVSNGANGLTNAMYTTSFGAANIVSNGVSTTLLANQQAYALKSVANINLNGNTLTIGDGTTAGMILSASITNGGAPASLAFGTAEALLYMISGNTGTIAVEVSGGGGLTKIGAGTLVLSNAGLWSSDITINNGTVILSPTANLTYAHGISGMGSLQKSGSAMLTLTNDYTVGGGVTVTAGTLTLAGGNLTTRNFTVSGGNTTLRLSNEVVSTKAGATTTVGNGSSNNLLTVLADTVWDGNAGSLTVGSGSATGNVLTINGGIVTNFGTVTVGGTTGNSLIVTNGGWLATRGTGARQIIGGTSNLMLITTGGAFSNTTTMTFSGSGNSLMVADGGQFGSSGQIEFTGGSSNTIWVTGSNSLLRVAIASGAGGYANNLIISNGGAANFAGQWALGWKSGWTANNQLTVTGTGSVFRAGNLVLGYNSGSNGGGSNIVTVTDGGLLVMGAFQIGGGTSGAAPSSNNLFLVTNGGVVTNTGFTGLGSLTYAGNNIIRVTGTNSLWYSTGSAFALASHTGSAVTNNGGNWLDVTNAATFYNGGALNVGVSQFGMGNNSNMVTVTSATFSNIGLITVGAGAGNDFNTMTVSNANVVSGGLTIGSANSSNNTVTVLSGTTWNMLAGALTVGANATTGNVLRLEGTAAITNIGTLRLTNSLNRILFNGGTLSVANAFVSNQVFTVGDGVQRATLQSLVGTQIFANGLLIRSNATLKGVGTLLTGGGQSVVITNGATLAPGNSPGLLTVDNVTWHGGSFFQLEVTNFTGTAGTSWDLLNVTGALTINPNGNPFIVNLDSMSNSAAAVNFNASNDYTLAFVNFGSQTGFNSSDFQVNTNAFNIGGAPAPGSWGVALVGANLYLTYSALSITPDFVWSNGATGAWSVGANWTNNLAGPTSDPARILKFGGTGATSYTSSNDTAGTFQLNQIVLASASTGTNTLTGGTIQFAGTTPLLYQQGGGLFIISNALNLAADTAFRGPGPGSAILASNITGAGQLTMGGAYNLVLQGSNTFTGQVLVDGSGGTLTLANLSAIGTNSLTVSNGTVASSIAYTLGRGWSNQAALITGTGSYWTNAAALTVGAGNVIGNSLTVQNSGSLFVNGSLVVGTNGAALNSLVISNGGRVFGTTAATADAYVGFAAGSNTVQIMGGGTAASPSRWDVGGRFVYVGSGAGGVSNSLVVDGIGITGSAVLTNAQINVGVNSVNAYNNSLIVTNGGKVARGGSSVTTIGANGARSNAVIIVGGGSGGGTSVWDNAAQHFRIGSGSGGSSLIGSNQLLVDGNGVVGGAVLRNVGSLTVGEQESWDSLVIANGGSVSSAGAVIIGNGISANANNNTATISGSTAVSVWTLGNNSLTIGSATTGVATNNQLVIGAGGIVTNISTVTIGVGTARTNALVLNGGQFWATSLITTTAGNRVVLNAGTLGLTGSTYSNGTAFVVGDGVNNATLQLGNGTHQFFQGINLVTNSALKGNNATLGATVTNTLIGGMIRLSAEAGNTFNLNGPIVGDAGQLIKQEGGTVTLSGNSTFSAPVAVNAGTLAIANSAGVGLGSLAPVTVNSDGNFVVNNSSGTGVAGPVTGAGGFISGTGTIAGHVTLNAGTLTAGNDSLDTLTMGVLTLNGGYLPFEFLTSGMNNDKLSVTDSGGLTINGGTVLLYTNNSTVRFDAAGVYNLIQYTGSIGGTGVTAFTVGNQANNRIYNFGVAGGFVTLTIGGTNGGWNPGSPMGDTWWTNAANWGGGSGPAPVEFDRLLFDGNTKVNNTNNFASNTRFAGIVFTNSAGAFVLNGMAAGTNAVNLVGNVVNLSANTQTINLPQVLEGGSRGFNTASNNMIANGVISGSDSTLGLIKQGPRMLTLTGANTYSGITEIVSGTLRATDGVGLPTASNLKLTGGVLETAGNFVRATGTVAGAVQWTGSGGFSAAGGSLVVNLSGGAPLMWGAGAFVPNGSALIFGSSTANGDVYFANAIDLNSGVRTVQVVRTATLLGALSNGGLSKTGNGTLVLAGNSTYSGATTVNAGTLVVNGQVAGDGAFVLAGGTTLGGTGVIARALSGAGRVAPGSSPGVLTAGAVDPTLGMDFSFEFTSLNLASYSSFNDVLRLTNAAPFTANLTGVNVVDLYIQTALVDGVTNVFRGGFYTDQAGNFDGRLANATFVVHGGGTLAYVQTVASSTFVPGGYVMEFGVVSGQTPVSVVPEPSMLLLCLGGMLTMWIARRRRSHSGTAQ
ncbi:MAG: hypothetical protein PCFJNLEI_00118 [Verrucomicrobiae bacterium]|nr:hypothetical protein [Verrucomicrobiae bacterium]